MPIFGIILIIVLALSAIVIAFYVGKVIQKEETSDLPIRIDALKRNLDWCQANSREKDIQIDNIYDVIPDVIKFYLNMERNEHVQHVNGRYRCVRSGRFVSMSGFNIERHDAYLIIQKKIQKMESNKYANKRN